MKNIYPYFSQNPLDRLDELRRDEQKIEELKNLKSSLFLLLNDNNIILNEKTNQCFFKKADLDTTQAVLLGRDKNIDYFALHVKSDIPEHLSKISIREFLEKEVLEENKLGIIAQGAAVLNWHQSHQFCSTCGKNTKMTHAGWRRDCIVCKKSISQELIL